MYKSTKTSVKASMMILLFDKSSDSAKFTPVKKLNGTFEVFRALTAQNTEMILIL